MFANLLQRLGGRLDRSDKVAFGIGVALAVLAIPLPTFFALILGLVAALAMGFILPDDAIRSGFLIALPIMVFFFLAGFLRGISITLLVVLLLPAFILPVGVAKVAADVRRGGANDDRDDQ